MELTIIDFAAWWNLYDYKTGKKKAQKLWAKLTAEDQCRCMDHTPAYVKATPEKRYRKHPATYLFNEAWNDEIITNEKGSTSNEERLAIYAVAALNAGKQIEA